MNDASRDTTGRSRDTTGRFPTPAASVTTRQGGAGPPPILIFGISQRSGTNYLAALLGCHADCSPPGPPIKEDHLLRDGPLLVRYARAAAGRWPSKWGERREAEAHLLRHLGGGLLRFLSEWAGDMRVVSKTPSTENLELYPRLIPDACVVLLVRDGRSVAESLAVGFGSPFELAVRTWREGARRILAFLASVEGENHGLQFCMVRYESLLDDLDGEMARILDFCGLDPARFDAPAARALPVLGSSFAAPDSARVSWEPMARPADFDAGARFASWSRARHERFNWVAGREQRALGYDTASFGSGALWALYNRVLDAVWPVRAAWYGARGAVVRALLTGRDRLVRRAGRPAPRSPQP